jgi:hypothetical protein
MGRGTVTFKCPEERKEGLNLPHGHVQPTALHDVNFHNVEELIVGKRENYNACAFSRGINVLEILKQLSMNACCSRKCVLFGLKDVNIQPEGITCCCLLNICNSLNWKEAHSWSE